MKTENTLINHIHFRPQPPGNLADTIPFYWEGTYHIFYLRNVEKVPWEHISSEDLVHWKELPTALQPDEVEDGPNGCHMFTGSLIYHNGIFHIFYTGWNRNNPKGREFILHATSRNLLAWTKQTDELIVPDGVFYDNNVQRNFRDPYVFWVEDNKMFRMLFCATDKRSGKSVTGVYESEDLIAWVPCEPLEIDTKYTSENGNECPDYFTIGDWHYLIISPIFSDGTLYIYSNNALGKYRDPKVSYIETPFLYAAKRMYDGKRHLLSGWIRDTKGEKDGPAEGWGGTMCLMREVYASEDGELCFRPANEVSEAYQEISQTRSPFKIPEKNVHTIKTPKDYMLDCLIDDVSSGSMIFKFRSGSDIDSGYTLTIDFEGSRISLKGPGFDYPRENCFIDGNNPIKIQAFLTGTVLECFINDRFAFSCRMYNYAEGDLEIVPQSAVTVIFLGLFRVRK